MTVCVTKHLKVAIILSFHFSLQLDGKEATASSEKEEEPDFFEETHGLPTHVDHHHQSWAVWILLSHSFGAAALVHSV